MARPGANLKRQALAKSLPFPNTPAAVIVVTVAWFVPVTVRKADVLWIVVPRTPAQDGAGDEPLA
jgi:hypothetical protein